MVIERSAEPPAFGGTARRPSSDRACDLLVAMISDMGSHMKTTIDLSDAVLRSAKAAAAREGTTVKALVEEGLRRVLAERAKRPKFRLRRVTFRGTGLQEGAREGGWERIRDLIYEGHGS
jgi:hypothetical protein